MVMAFFRPYLTKWPKNVNKTLIKFLWKNWNEVDMTSPAVGPSQPAVLTCSPTACVSCLALSGSTWFVEVAAVAVAAGMAAAAGTLAAVAVFWGRRRTKGFFKSRPFLMVIAIFHGQLWRQTTVIAQNRSIGINYSWERMGSESHWTHECWVTIKKKKQTLKKTKTVRWGSSVSEGVR